MKKKYIAISLCLVIIVGIVALGRIFLVNSIEVVFDRQPVSVTDSEIISASELPLGINIFSIDEKQVIDNVQSYYGDNSVSIKNVERIFPNKVRLYAEERVALLDIPTADGRYIPTDMDFRLNTIKTEPAEGLIKVSGVEITDSFALTELYDIRTILHALSDGEGLTVEGINKFINEIKVTDEGYVLLLNSGDGAITLKKSDDLNNRTLAAYEDYLVALKNGESLNINIIK